MRVYKIYKIFFLLNSESNISFNFPGHKKNFIGQKTQLMIKVVRVNQGLNPHEVSILKVLERRTSKQSLIKHGVPYVEKTFELEGHRMTTMWRVDRRRWKTLQPFQTDEIIKLVEVLLDVVRIELMCISFELIVIFSVLFCDIFKYHILCYLHNNGVVLGDLREESIAEGLDRKTFITGSFDKQLKYMRMD